MEWEQPIVVVEEPSVTGPIVAPATVTATNLGDYAPIVVPSDSALMGVSSLGVGLGVAGGVGLNSSLSSLGVGLGGLSTPAMFPGLNSNGLGMQAGLGNSGLISLGMSNSLMGLSGLGGTSPAGFSSFPRSSSLPPFNGTTGGSGLWDSAKGPTEQSGGYRSLSPQSERSDAEQEDASPSGGEWDPKGKYFDSSLGPDCDRSAPFLLNNARSSDNKFPYLVVQRFLQLANDEVARLQSEEAALEAQQEALNQKVKAFTAAVADQVLLEREEPMNVRCRPHLGVEVSELPKQRPHPAVPTPHTYAAPSNVGCTVFSPTRCSEHDHGLADVVVRKVLPGCAAEEAGMKEKDILRTWDGIEIKNRSEFAVFVENAEIGTVVKIQVQRGKSNHTLRVVIQGITQNVDHDRSHTRGSDGVKLDFSPILREDSNGIVNHLSRMNNTTD